MKATILISTHAGADKAKEIYDALRSDKAEDVYLLAGIYDLMVPIDFDDVDRLRHLIVERIHGTGVVLRTATLLHLDESDGPVAHRPKGKERVVLLIATEGGRVHNVQQRLRNADVGLAKVVSVNLVTGNYDLIAIVEGDSLDAVNQWTNAVVHRMQGVERTETLLYM